MDIRPLGSTGLRVSVLGLGTVKFGRDRQVNYATPFRIPDDDEAAALLAAAAEEGINLIDTAPAYGLSEHRLGTLLRGQRDRWVIVTKAGEEFIDGRSRFDFSPAAIRASVERSLRRLQTDRIDAVLIHSDGRDVELIEHTGAIESLTRLREEGKIVALGMSTKTSEGSHRALACCDVLMVTLSDTHRDELTTIRAAHAAGVGILIKKSLAGGHNLSTDAAGVPAAWRLALAEPGVSSIIVGTANPTHLRSNARAVRSIRHGGQGF
ncbi:MAG: aldo/keto reductase [Phycisphaeraceae bacterium]|nr:aldo/keto reductase [Phycisphaeraceae bacterium]